MPRQHIPDGHRMLVPAQPPTQAEGATHPLSRSDDPAQGMRVSYLRLCRRRLGPAPLFATTHRRTHARALTHKWRVTRARSYARAEAGPHLREGQGQLGRCGTCGGHRASRDRVSLVALSECHVRCRPTVATHVQRAGEVGVLTLTRLCLRSWSTTCVTVSL